MEINISIIINSRTSCWCERTWNQLNLLLLLLWCLKKLLLCELCLLWKNQQNWLLWLLLLILKVRERERKKKLETKKENETRTGCGFFFEIRFFLGTSTQDSANPFWIHLLQGLSTPQAECPLRLKSPKKWKTMINKTQFFFFLNSFLVYLSFSFNSSHSFSSPIHCCFFTIFHPPIHLSVFWFVYFLFYYYYFLFWSKNFLSFFTSSCMPLELAIFLDHLCFLFVSNERKWKKDEIRSCAKSK